jgi:hypothetical protein
MAITFSCSCGKEITVKDQFAGKKGKCPACGAIMQVPAVKPPEPAAPEPEPEIVISEPAPDLDEPAGETKTCLHCQKKIPMDAVFCVHCGTNLRTGKKADTDHGGVEGDYDYFKAFPNMIAKPAEAIDTISQATPNAQNFQKAMALLGLSAVVMAWALYKTNTLHEIRNLPMWFVVIPLFLSIAATFVSGVIAGIAGTTFGSTGLPIANTFMAVVASRTLVGLAMILPMLIAYAAPGFVLLADWTGTAVRVLIGGGLMYLILQRTHECGHSQSGVFAGIAVVVEGILFWITALIFNLAWGLQDPNTLRLF